MSKSAKLLLLAWVSPNPSPEEVMAFRFEFEELIAEIALSKWPRRRQLENDEKLSHMELLYNYAPRMFERLYAAFMEEDPALVQALRSVCPWLRTGRERINPEVLAYNAEDAPAASFKGLLRLNYGRFVSEVNNEILFKTKAEPRNSKKKTALTRYPDRKLSPSAYLHGGLRMEFGFDLETADWQGDGEELDPDEEELVEFLSSPDEALKLEKIPVDAPPAGLSTKASEDSLNELSGDDHVQAERLIGRAFYDSVALSNYQEYVLKVDFGSSAGMSVAAFLLRYILLVPKQQWHEKIKCKTWVDYPEENWQRLWDEAHAYFKRSFKNRDLVLSPEWPSIASVIYGVEVASKKQINRANQNAFRAWGRFWLWHQAHSKLLGNPAALPALPTLKFRRLKGGWARMAALPAEVSNEA